MTRACIALAIALSALAPGSALAAYGPARLVSASATEQAGGATNRVAVSASGRFVVFETVARNLADLSAPPGQYRRGGLFRKDTVTGALELVAAGDLVRVSDGELVSFGAGAPSVSADGRYVAFSSGDRLTTGDTNSQTDVYVRDMERPVEDPDAYELASALDGHAEAPQYVGAADDLRGSIVSPGAGISANGDKVAFATVLPANLPAGVATIEDGQVFVRDLDSDSTSVVNVVRETGSGAMTSTPAAGANDNGAAGKVAISGDGTTVAWASASPSTQTPSIAGELPSAVDLLWRRIADGPQAPTRRVAGTSDPEDPACPPDGTVTTGGPCQGPLLAGAGFSAGDGQFALSHDGATIAFTTRARRPGVLQDGTGLPDAFVSDMRAGVSRKAGLRELTREDGAGLNETTSADITSIAISPDGRFVALTSIRTRFLLPTPTLVGIQPNFDGAASRLYLVDLVDDTIELVLRARGGGDPAGGHTDRVSLSAGGARIATVSAASNLFFGDGNGVADAFIVDRLDDAAAPEPETLPALEDDVSLSGSRRLRVTARSTSKGTLKLDVFAPGPGTLQASMKASRRSGSARTLGRRASASVVEASTVTLLLRPAKRYRRAVRRPSGLAVRASVGFRSQGNGGPGSKVSISAVLHKRKVKR